MTQEPQMLLIPQKLAQDVVDYLKRRPFEEVFQLIGAMVKLPLAPVPAPAPAPPKEG